VLAGQRGAYTCKGEVAEVSVPGTLQAAIAARIDRLHPVAKRTLWAAAVIGSRFSLDMLEALKTDRSLNELVQAELVDQVAFTPRAEYAFRHPLIRTVAYESQLKSDRAQLHRRLAAAIEQHDQNAALIAEHLEAAGDLHAAYSWHMRAGQWLINRDIVAAQMSWERARQVADALPANDPGRLAMRIAPRTLLCGSGWRRFHESVSSRFEELRDLCTEAGDKASLAVGMAGLATEHVLNGRVREASRLASEQMALLESINNATLTLGLSFAACVAKAQAAEFTDVLRWSQTAIQLADGDPTKGNFILGSPLAAAFVGRGLARWSLGRPGWREDLDQAVAMARETDPLSLAAVIAYKYAVAISRGVVLADDAALRDIEEALQSAERSSDDMTLVLLQMTLGIALIHHDAATRHRGFDVLAQLRATCVKEQFGLNVVPVFDMYAARDKAARGNVDGAVQQLRTVVDDLFTTGNIVNCNVAIDALVETLLARGADGDVTEAEAAIERLAAVPITDWVVRDISVLRLRALLARARRDEATYRELVERYRAIARSLGFEGHMAWAAAMT
jgi:adenylate cyclase